MSSNIDQSSKCLKSIGGGGVKVEHQQEFAADMCKLFVSCMISWNTARNPQMHLFISKWIPGSTVPDCGMLSGYYYEVEKVEEATRKKVKGKLATLQLDG